MNCKKCNAEIDSNAKFCPRCGTPIEVTVCKKCNTQINQNDAFCPNCGTPVGETTCRICGGQLKPTDSFCPYCGTSVSSSVGAPVDKPQSVNPNNDIADKPLFQAILSMQSRSLPACILGLIGSVFGLFGGICTTICSSFFSSGIAPMLLIFGGSVVGLIGACKCLKKALMGSALELIAAIMIIICAYGITGSDFMTIIGMLLLLTGGLIGFIPSVIQFSKAYRKK